MTNTLHQLDNAICERNAARLRFEAAKTRKARIEAEEWLNFWQGKVASLEALVRKEAA